MAPGKKDIKHRNLVFLLIIGTIVLLSKSAQLQVFDTKYQEKAQRNTLEQQMIFPSRGLIYDRHQELMVINKPIYELMVVYNKIDPGMDTTFFCQLLQIDKSEFLERVNKDWKDPRFHKSIAFSFMSKIDPELFARFEEHQFSFPGFYGNIRNIRSYPHENAAHFLGYLGEVDQAKIDEEESDYLLGDFIGVSGLEKEYEDKLMGKKGVKYLFKDNLGREVSSYREGQLDLSSEAGVDLITGIDLSLQSLGEELMKNKRGSIVAIEPKSGEVLTMISAPSYDPNLLNLDQDRTEAYFDLLNDTLNKPFLDRSVLAKYPPGSIFKPILSLIAFQEEASNPDFSISCNSKYTYKTFNYGCHEHPKPWNVEIALANSCNSYYFQMVRDLIEKEGWTKPGVGIEILRSHLNNFGLGRPLGVDLVQENSGFIPSAQFYDKLYEGNAWRSTYVMSIGIGQGELELTTLQMANLAAIVANKGYYYIPHLVKGYSDGRQIDEKYTRRKNVNINATHFDRVIDGMHRAVEYGTGYKARVKGIDICGKTGTSQNIGKDHSVFFAFAPKEDPQIAIAVYVENAGFGGDIAAPIASLMIESYLNDEEEQKRDYLKDQIESIDLLERIKPEL